MVDEMRATSAVSPPPALPASWFSALPSEAFCRRSRTKKTQKNVQKRVTKGTNQSQKVLNQTQRYKTSHNRHKPTTKGTSHKNGTKPVTKGTNTKKTQNQSQKGTYQSQKKVQNQSQKGTKSQKRTKPAKKAINQ